MTPQKRRLVAVSVIFVVLVGVVLSQTVFAPTPTLAIEQADEAQQALLKQVFPTAEVFSIKEGPLPHYKAYATDPESDEMKLVGFAFMTHEVEPDEWAYESELEILVGMTVEGVITGIKLIDHYEPFGYFSIEPEEFAAQFPGKSILDPFVEGDDIDTVSRATISIESAARVIRKSARQIARQHLSSVNKQ